MKLFMFIAFFLLLGAFYIISEQNINLNNRESFNTFFFNYYAPWIGGLFDNAKTVSGYVIGMQWLPE